MSLDARLNKVMPVLSARERGILVLKSLKDKTPENPSLRRTMPPEQMSEFNRLIVLMNACNIYLPLFITMVEQQAEQMEVRVSWMLTLSQFGTALWQLGALVPPSKRKQAERAMAGFWPFVELPWDGEQHDHSWLDIAESMEKTIRECVAHLWDDLVAIDAVLAEVAVSFNGEDPMRPVMRGVLEKARSKLSVMHEVFSGKEAIEVTVPTEEALELAQTYFDKGLQLMESI